MKIRITHIDGKLPNLALMRLSAFHRAQGDEVHFTRSIERSMFEPEYDRVYASAIFQYSHDRLQRFRSAWPNAIIGGTASGNNVTVEDIVGPLDAGVDYSSYPDFTPSLGFTQRGCRLKCSFCVVPKKEGKNRSVDTVDEIWRGPGHPKKLHLLDNDFFGQPKDQWQARLDEIREGAFKVCLNQGINVRLIDDEAADGLATIEYRDDQFKERRLYTAWDNIGDERIFFAGMDRLERAGIPAKHIMAYMLIGFDPKETMERIHYRFQKMVDRGILPYPMVFDRSKKELTQFQRYVVTGLYRKPMSFAEYKAEYRAASQDQGQLNYDLRVE
jgi:hypothetical protein